jgi:hypothetical protein
MDKLTIWVRPTGWRPQGMEEKYPVAKITDPYNFEKFNPPYTKEVLVWSILQFVVFFLAVNYALYHVAVLGLEGVIALAIFALVQIYSATELMNGNKRAPLFSSISTVVCVGIYMYNPTLFGLSQSTPLLPAAFVAYVVVQPIVSFALMMREGKLAIAGM